MRAPKILGDPCPLPPTWGHCWALPGTLRCADSGEHGLGCADTGVHTRTLGGDGRDRTEAGGSSAIGRGDMPGGWAQGAQGCPGRSHPSGTWGGQGLGSCVLRAEGLQERRPRSFSVRRGAWTEWHQGPRSPSVTHCAPSPWEMLCGPPGVLLSSLGVQGSWDLGSAEDAQPWTTRPRAPWTRPSSLAPWGPHLEVGPESLPWLG